MVCFFPCRGINAIFLSLNSPIVIESEGLPYGVSTDTSVAFFSKPESYIPVPPKIPISASAWKKTFVDD